MLFGLRCTSCRALGVCVLFHDVLDVVLECEERLECAYYWLGFGIALARVGFGFGWLLLALLCALYRSAWRCFFASLLRSALIPFESLLCRDLLSSVLLCSGLPLSALR